MVSNQTSVDPNKSLHGVPPNRSLKTQLRRWHLPLKVKPLATGSIRAGMTRNDYEEERRTSDGSSSGDKLIKGRGSVIDWRPCVNY